jgi:hypothetical protein
MTFKLLFATILGAALATATPSAFATVKIIHVPDVLAGETLPNPPAGEDEAAKMHGRAEGLPRVLRLWRPKPSSTASVPHLVKPPLVLVTCGQIDDTASNAAGAFYGPADRIYGGQIAFPTPAWDSSRFLPLAGWSERPDLWASHIR